MLIKDILTETARLLGCEQDGEIEEDEEKKLLSGLKFVIDELALSYFPLVKTETVPLTGGKALYESFSRTPMRIYGAKSDGKTVGFTRLSDGLKVDTKAEEVEITYALEPSEPTVEGETEWKESVPLRILAYGTATEYCLMHGLEDDAAMWDKRYRDALSDLSRLSSSGRKIQARRWL